MSGVEGESTAVESALTEASTTSDQGTGADASATGDPSATPNGDKPAWKAIDWSTVDVQELIREVPSLQGVIGNLSQKQAQQRVQKLLEEERARVQAEAQQEAVKRDREERLRLAREDPDKLAEKVVEEVTKEEYQEYQNGIRRSMQNELHGYIQAQVQEVYDDPDVQDVMKDADRDTLTRLDWRNHPGLASWVKTVNKIVADAKANKVSEKRAEELYKARAKASEKAGAIEGVQADASDGVDLGLAGGVPGGRLFTRADLADMAARGDLETYRKYKAIIAVQEREGRIK